MNSHELHPLNSGLDLYPGTHLQFPLNGGLLCKADAYLVRNEISLAHLRDDAIDVNMAFLVGVQNANDHRPKGTLFALGDNPHHRPDFSGTFFLDEDRALIHHNFLIANLPGSHHFFWAADNLPLKLGDRPASLGKTCPRAQP